MKLGKALLFLAGAPIVAGTLFWLLTAIVSREIWRVYYVQMEQQAAKTAQKIETDVSQMLERSERSNPTIDSFISELFRDQPAIKIVVIERPDRIVLDAFAIAGTEHDAFLRRLGRLAGYPGIPLIEHLRGQYPQLEMKPLLTRNGSRMDIFYDTKPPVELVNQSAMRTAGQLALVVAAMGAVAWMAAYRRQRSVENRLRRQRARTEQFAYMATLAAGLAHEIRNPLNALAMQLEMLEEDAPAASAARASGRIQKIKDGVRVVEKTVGEFLNYAAPGNQQPAMVELDPELGALCSEFRDDHPLGTAECETGTGMRAWCDINALRQILGNLVSNACRAQKSNPPKLRIWTAKEGKQVVIGVDDAGPGVAEANRKQIFECFFTTRGEGSGLGLPIAQRLAEMNGGALELSPEPSPLGGARFLLKLPAVPQEAVR